MVYNKFHSEWKNLPNKTTPVTAQALDHIEDGLKRAHDVTDVALTIEEANATYAPVVGSSAYAPAADYALKAEVSTKSAGGSLYLPGSAGNYVSTPDHADLKIVGDIDIRVHLALPAWAPSGTKCIAAKGDGSGAADNSWRIDLNSAGTPLLRIYTGGAGSAEIQLAATQSMPTVATNGQLIWLRVTLDVDNGSSGKTARFYTSADGETWTKLGNDVTHAGVTTLWPGSQPVIVGAFTTAGLAPIEGEIREFQLRDGIDGLVVAHLKTDVPVLRYRDSTGKLWVVAGSSWSFLGKG